MINFIHNLSSHFQTYQYFCSSLQIHSQLSYQINPFPNPKPYQHDSFYPLPHFPSRAHREGQHQRTSPCHLKPPIIIYLGQCLAGLDIQCIGACCPLLFQRWCRIRMKRAQVKLFHVIAVGFIVGANTLQGQHYLNLRLFNLTNIVVVIVVVIFFDLV